MNRESGTGKYEQLLARCRGLAPVPTAVVHPCEETALAGAIEAGAKGLITPILVGPAAKIQEVAKQSGIDLGAAPIVDAAHSHAAAAKAVELVREGQAELLMKGSLHTDELLGAVVARETGLRTGRRISHVFIMDVPTYHKVLIVTDAAINIAPTLEDKVDICQNAIDLARSLGVERPKVAILAAVETVTSKMPATIDAAALCKMAERGQITGGVPGRSAGVRQRDQQGRGEDQGNPVGGRRRSRHPPRAGSGGGQHPGQAAQLPGQCRQRRSGSRRPRADHPDEPRRQRAIEDRQLRGRDAGGARAAADASTSVEVFGMRRLRGGTQCRLIEPQVLRLPEAEGRQLAPGSAGPDRGHRDVAAILRQGRRGRIPGRSHTERDRARWAHRARCLAEWLRSRYGGARVLGVGHRVVHGGATFAGPTIVTPEVLAELRALVPLAPLHQPHNLAAIEAVAERLPGVPQVACFDTSFHRGQPAVAEVVPLPREICGRACSDTASMACRTSTSLRSCRRSRRRSPAGASSSLTWEAARACAP